ncbi:hypothetical protein DUNSADRAFT_10355 [Dunaliella salina]|uniref:Uncharacterized protein n=1 Tax=Dunaliella salina TaxID=3046 RepID=A0ABQ7H532_DUNSA|nr:hypothetical protein DUNSADRAFT_10355 [Dunaliella salina]|eukprot:KAF5841918.1 hypothetical protein DUNSADRAFT_10355 [Dunaliella salina]
MCLQTSCTSEQIKTLHLAAAAAASATATAATPCNSKPRAPATCGAAPSYRPISCPYCQGIVPQPLPPILQDCHTAGHHATPTAQCAVQPPLHSAKNHGTEQHATPGAQCAVTQPLHSTQSHDAGHHATPAVQCAVPNPLHCVQCPEPQPLHSSQSYNAGHHATSAAAQHPQNWCCSIAASTAACPGQGPWQQKPQESIHSIPYGPIHSVPSNFQAPPQAAQQQQHGCCTAASHTATAAAAVQGAQRQTDVHALGGQGKEVSSLLLKEELSLHPEAPLPLNHEGPFLNRQQPWQQQQQQRKPQCYCLAPAASRQPSMRWDSPQHPLNEFLHLPLQQQQQQQQHQHQQQRQAFIRRQVQQQQQQRQDPFRQQVQQEEQQQQPLQPQLRQVPEKPHQQQRGDSLSVADDDSDGDGLPGRCQDGGAEGGRRALLQFLHHKMTQLRHHRLLRNVLVAWKQAASAKKIDRLLLETVDRLHAERVLQGTFAAWRALAQEGVRSPCARSPAQASRNPSPTEARTPCSSTSSSEHARPARPTALSPLPLISPLPQLPSPTLGPAVPGTAESAVAAAAAAAAGGSEPQRGQEDCGAQASPTSSVSFQPFVGQGKDQGSQLSTPCLQLPTKNGGDGSRVVVFDEMRRMLLRMEAMLQQPEGLDVGSMRKPLSCSDAMGSKNGALPYPCSRPLPQHTDHTPLKVGIPTSTTSQVSAILRSPGGTVLNGSSTTGLGSKQEQVVRGEAAVQHPGHCRSDGRWSSSHCPPRNTTSVPPPLDSLRARNAHSPPAAGHGPGTSWCPRMDAGLRVSRLWTCQPAKDAGLRNGLRGSQPHGDAGWRRSGLRACQPAEDAATLVGPSTAQAAHHAAHHHMLVQQDAADLQFRIATLLQGRQPGEALQGRQPGEALQGRQPGEALQGRQPGEALQGRQAGEALQGRQAGEALQGRQAGEALQGRQGGEALRGGLAGEAPRPAVRPPQQAVPAGEAASLDGHRSAAPVGEAASLHGPLVDILAMRAQLQGMLHHLARVEAEVEKKQHPPSLGSPRSSARAQAPSTWVPTFPHSSGMPITSKPKWRAIELGTQDPESLLHLELAELEQKLRMIRTKQNDLKH